MVSSTSGYTNTELNEVCLRALLSNGEILTSRCTPLSALRKPYAKGPSNCKVAVLIPAPSPQTQSSSVTFQPCLSPYILYIRASISAQSWLSVPPAPLLICNTAGSSSSGSLSVLLNSASSIC